MSLLENIDLSFIIEMEGNSCTGCVPASGTSQSGVTIACGYDLGQRGKSEIVNCFPGPLGDKLQPYAGLIKSDAVNFLKSNPLTISQEESELINERIANDMLNKIKAAWNSSKTFTEFEKLSVACATVIFSVSFQYGNLSKRTPNFWRQATQGSWEEMISNLRNFGDNYPARRNKEADLISNWLNKKG